LFLVLYRKIFHTKKFDVLPLIVHRPTGRFTPTDYSIVTSHLWPRPFLQRSKPITATVFQFVAHVITLLGYVPEVVRGQALPVYVGADLIQDGGRCKDFRSPKTIATGATAYRRGDIHFRLASACCCSGQHDKKTYVYCFVLSLSLSQ